MLRYTSPSVVICQFLALRTGPKSSVKIKGPPVIAGALAAFVGLLAEVGAFASVTSGSPLPARLEDPDRNKIAPNKTMSISAAPAAIGFQGKLRSGVTAGKAIVRDGPWIDVTRSPRTARSKSS